MRFVQVLFGIKIVCVLNTMQRILMERNHVPFNTADSDSVLYTVSDSETCSLAKPGRYFWNTMWAHVQYKSTKWLWTNCHSGYTWIGYVGWNTKLIYEVLCVIVSRPVRAAYCSILRRQTAGLHLKSCVIDGYFIRELTDKFGAYHEHNHRKGKDHKYVICK